MSTALLGTHFDIHGGGMDLKFPHHENEIAQSCGANGDEFADIWMHNGFVNIDNEKMSKSLGNFFTVREVLPRLRHPEVLRYFVLASHYRGPINYSLEQLEQADSALARIYTALRDLPEVEVVESEHSARFREVMDDDFNTPEAIAVLQNMTREINSAKATGQPKKLAQAAALGAELRSLASVLGLAQVAPEEYLKLQSSRTKVDADARQVVEAGAGQNGLRGSDASPAIGLSDSEIDQRIADRIAARKAKNWAESDRIRDELTEAGVILEDKPGGTTAWRRA